MKYLGYCLLSLFMGGTYPTLCKSRDWLLEYRNRPSVRAFLDTISFAEGTAEKDGYSTLFTYRKFNDFSDHPREVICALYKGKKLCSSASGRYQFLRKTWDRIAPLIEAADFSPIEQDRGAIYLLWENDALDDILDGNFEQAIRKVGTIWASMPGSPYGQPVKSMEDLEKIFQKRRGRYQRIIRQRGGYLP